MEQLGRLLFKVANVSTKDAKLYKGEERACASIQVELMSPFIRAEDQEISRREAPQLSG